MTKKSLNTNNSAELKVVEGSQQMAEYLAEELKDLCARDPDQTAPVTVVLPGGNTPGEVFRHLAVQPDIDWTRVHIFFSDERFVLCNEKYRNIDVVRDNLLSGIDIPFSNVHAVPLEGEVEQAAAGYEEAIRGFFGLQEGEVPHFDLMVLGLGNDGHTASLFPGQPDLISARGLTTTLKQTDPRKERISLTLSVINAARHVCFMVRGQDKQDIVRRVYSQSPPAVPAALVSPANGRLTLLLDREAAGMLVST